MRHSRISERRKTQRRPIFLEGTISFAGRYRLRCLVQSLSRTGAKLTFKAATETPGEFTLNVFLAGEEAKFLARPRWRGHRSVGVEFAPPPMTNVVWFRDYAQTQVI